MRDSQESVDAGPEITNMTTTNDPQGVPYYGVFEVFKIKNGPFRTVRVGDCTLSAVSSHNCQINF